MGTAYSSDLGVVHGIHNSINDGLAALRPVTVWWAPESSGVVVLDALL